MSQNPNPTTVDLARQLRQVLLTAEAAAERVSRGLPKERKRRALRVRLGLSRALNQLDILLSELTGDTRRGRTFPAEPPSKPPAQVLILRPLRVLPPPEYRPSGHPPEPHRLTRPWSRRPDPPGAA